MIQRLKRWWRRVIKQREYTIKIFRDPADFIVEVRDEPDSITGVSFRLKEWLPEARRYEFLGDYYYRDHVAYQLTRLGIKFSQVGIAELREHTGEGALESIYSSTFISDRKR